MLTADGAALTCHVLMSSLGALPSRSPPFAIWQVFPQQGCPPIRFIGAGVSFLLFCVDKKQILI